MTRVSVIILMMLFILKFCQSLEENTRFCIRKDPLLLDDMESQENAVVGDYRCEILATTLTVKEKETLHKTMCKDYGSTHKDEYHFFQLHNGNLKGRANHREICDGKRNLYLVWIPYKTMQEYYAAELNPKEHISYIAKATNIEREKTELCHFRHTDLATNINENLFTCIVMVFEDNFYGLDANINVLVEILPLMYELRNVTYLPWANVTTSYKTRMGEATLNNHSSERKKIYGSIAYAYVEKIKLNMSSIYGKELNHLPILFHHKGSTLELNNTGIGGVNIKERAYFGRYMDPKTSVNVELIGQWAEYNQIFASDIYEYFGYGISRFRQETSGAEASFVRIQNTEPIYESPESNYLAVATLYKSSGKHIFSRLTAAASSNGTAGGEWDEDTDDDTAAENDLDLDAEEFDVPPSEKNSIYYPWSVIAGLVVGGLLVAALVGIVRACNKEEDAHKYKVTRSG